MKILLVYNYFAGNGRAKKLLPQVEGLLNKYSIEFDLALTDYPEHGIEIVANTNFSNTMALLQLVGTELSLRLLMVTLKIHLRIEFQLEYCQLELEMHLRMILN